MLKRDGAVKFANDCAAAWNARDIERVLAAFSQDVKFVSPTAFAVVDGLGRRHT